MPLETNDIRHWRPVTSGISRNVSQGIGCNVCWRPMASGIGRDVSQGISCNVFKQIVMLLPSRDHGEGWQLGHDAAALGED